MKARAAVKDVARVLRLPPGETDTLTKLIPSGPDVLAHGRRGDREGPRGRASLVKDEPAVRAAACELALALEGISRHLSCTPPAW